MHSSIVAFHLLWFRHQDTYLKELNRTMRKKYLCCSFCNILIIFIKHNSTSIFWVFEHSASWTNVLPRSVRPFVFFCRFIWQIPLVSWRVWSEKKNNLTSPEISPETSPSKSGLSAQKMGFYLWKPSKNRSTFFFIIWLL